MRLIRYISGKVSHTDQNIKKRKKYFFLEKVNQTHSTIAKKRKKNNSDTMYVRTFLGLNISARSLGMSSLTSWLCQRFSFFKD